MKTSVSECVLCRHPAAIYSSDKSREYYHCSNCQLVFVRRDQLIDLVTEKQRYDLHHNDEEDVLYQKYLKQIALTIIPQLDGHGLGLDFGCGRTHLLAKIFKNEGFEVDSYDVFYHPDEKIWDKKYDFIILSEVIEHLREPLWIMQKLRSILNRNGKIFIKTALYSPDKSRFENWYYKKDPTHIQFFNLRAFEELRRLLNMQQVEALSADLFEFTS